MTQHGGCTQTFVSFGFRSPNLRISCSYSSVLMNPDITIQDSKGDICGNRFFILFGVTSSLAS